MPVFLAQLRRAGEPVRPELLDIRRRPRVVTWTLAAVVSLFAVYVGWRLAANPNMRTDVIAKYMFDDVILEGVLVTLELTVLSGVAAVILGFLIACAGQSKDPVARMLSRLYIWFFRAVPLLVLLLFLFNLALFFPEITLGIPWTGWAKAWDTNEIVTGFSASLVALALHEAAYLAEIFRSGFIAVPKGQTEAALSMGLRPGQVLWRIVLPQSIRVIIPATGNQFILILKSTSLVSVVGGGDLLTHTQHIYGQNLLVIPLLMVATLWYLILIGLAQVGQYYLEKTFASERGDLTRSEQVKLQTAEA